MIRRQLSESVEQLAPMNSKKKRFALPEQVSSAERQIVAARGEAYLQAAYLRSGIKTTDRHALSTNLEKLALLQFELGKLSGTAAAPPSPPPVTSPISSAAIAAESPTAAPMPMATNSEPAAQPSPESLRALAAVLWPTENVQDLEGISRRVWFDGLQVPGFDRATLDAKYGETRPKPKGHSRILTAIDQAKVDAFFKTHFASAGNTTTAPTPSVPDLAQLRAMAATVLPGRDYWNMDTAEIHKILWQEHLSIPGMDENALEAKYWRPTAATATIAKVVRAQRQSRLEKLLTEKRVFNQL